MAKMSKEDLIKKVSEKVVDDELQIELIEDITDSFDVTADNTELEELKTKYEELKTKYKERFLNSSEDKDKKDDKKEELEEKEIVNVTEI